MSHIDHGPPEPRHRKKGRARKRGTGLPGRRLRTAPESGTDPGIEQDGCDCPPGYHEYGIHAPG